MTRKAYLAAALGVALGGGALTGCATEQEARRTDAPRPPRPGATKVTVTQTTTPGKQSDEQARRLRLAEEERRRAAVAEAQAKSRARAASLEADRLREERAMDAARAEAAAAQAGQDAARAAKAQQELKQREAELARLRAEQATLSAQLEQQKWEAEQRAASLEKERGQRAEAEARARAALEQVATVRQEARGLVVSMSAPVLFEFDEANLLPSARQKLDVIAAALRESGNQEFRIEGHTDAMGSDGYNVDLSRRRAQAVRDYLVERGVTEEQVAALGFGEERPVASNETPEGRANNRRVEIVLPDFGGGSSETGIGGAGEEGGAIESAPGDYPVPDIKREDAPIEAPVEIR